MHGHLHIKQTRSFTQVSARNDYSGCARDGPIAAGANILQSIKQLIIVISIEMALFNVDGCVR